VLELSLPRWGFSSFLARFIYIEQAFFQRWWAEADSKSQQLTQQLVASGQLEFINGGWCMHDEANPSFVDMIDQTTLGHRLLLEQFGVMPKTTWQIDPFGHSAFQATAFGPQSGFNALFFARADYQDYNARSKNGTMEMFWAPSASQGLSAGLLTGIMSGGYGPPGGLDMVRGRSRGSALSILLCLSLRVSNFASICSSLINICRRSGHLM
jgi:alpha-mannosidase